MRNTHPTTLGNLDLDSFYVADVTALGLQSSFGFLSALEVLLDMYITKNFIVLFVPRFQLIFEFFVLRYNSFVCLQCSPQKNNMIVGNLRHFVLGLL